MMGAPAGEHVVVFGGIEEGLAGRAAGYEVRDAVLVVLPGGSVTAWVFRAPLGGSVLEASVRGEPGALGIEASRVQGGGRKQATAGRRTIKWGVGEGGSSYALGTGAVWVTEGRWPPNVVFVHGRGCRRAVGSEGVVSWACAPGCSASGLGEDGRYYPQFAGVGELLGWLDGLVNPRVAG